MMPTDTLPSPLIDKVVLKPGSFPMPASRAYQLTFRSDLSNHKTHPKSSSSRSQRGYNIGQFIADFSDTGCDDSMPSSMVWVYGDQLYSRVKFGSICDHTITTYGGLASVQAGTWHRVEIQADWQSEATGYQDLV